MGFQLSDIVDQNKMFLVKKREIQERLDPNFYRPYSKLFDEIYGLVSLREIALLIKHPPEHKRMYSDRGIQLIRSQNVRPYGIDLNNAPVFLTPTGLNQHNDIYPEIGDVLVVRSGANAGDIAVVDVELPNTIIGADTLLIRFDSNIEPKFIQVFFSLDIGKEIIQRYLTGATNKHVSPYYLGKIKIPLLPLEIQHQIIAKMNTAYVSKKEKEADAKSLLDSVDDYLLKELGIELPKVEKKIIQDSVFTCKFSEVTGNRLDPLYHQGDIFLFVRDSNCEIKPLGNYVITFLSGFAAGRDDQGREQDGVIQIRPTNISEDRELVFRRNVYIASDELKKRPFDRLRRHEVLFNNTNSQEQVGKTVYFDMEGDYFCSNHITRIATDGDRLDPQYLVYILNLYQRQKVFFKLCTNWNNQSGVGADVLSKITIPLPGLECQKQIVLRLDKIREDAQELRRKAAVELEEAKKAIEAMILGKS
jgi:type I restriction enzyme M protein